MQRTHHSRDAGGAFVLVVTMILTLVVTLLVEAVGGSARADVAPTPSPTDPTATTSTLQPSTPTASVTPATTQTPLTRQLASGPPTPPPQTTATPDYLVLRRGLSFVLNVASNDHCAGPCAYTLVSRPTGWTVSVTPAGLMSIKVPATTAARRYPISYRITDGIVQVTGSVTVSVTLDNYTAPNGAVFSHPYRKRYRNKIRHRILRTINSVPSGSRIQVASWSFASDSYFRALNQARARGVVVQIVLSARNKPAVSDWRRLVRKFGTSVTPNGNWVRRCTYSCRGTRGTMHSKIFLFSQVYRTPWVTLTGSANLTDFAVTNQWNQMNTVSGPTATAKAVYLEAQRVFVQMSADRPLANGYVETHYPGIWTYYYPTTGVSASRDFMVRALAPVRCTGAVNAGKGGHTIIKIAMYAWYQQRGTWLAKRVRQLWQQGCQIQIVYAISSNPVKKILYSPAGRGRIPMRQILLTNTQGSPIYYLHDKWVAIDGHYGSNPAATVSLQGSFNFADLGFVSDEQFQRITGRAVYASFARDFGLLWTDRQARAPSPVSTIPTITGRYTQNDLALGTGTYRYMQAD